MPIENDNRLGPNADALRYNDDGEDQSMTSGIDFAQAPMQLSLAEGVAVNGALGASLAELTGIAPSQFRDQSFGGLAPSHLAATDTFAQAAVASTGLYDWREQPSPFPESPAIGIAPTRPYPEPIDEHEEPPEPEEPKVIPVPPSCRCALEVVRLSGIGVEEPYYGKFRLTGNDPNAGPYVISSPGGAVEFSHTLQGPGGWGQFLSGDMKCGDMIDFRVRTSTPGVHDIVGRWGNQECRQVIGIQKPQEQGECRCVASCVDPNSDELFVDSCTLVVGGTADLQDPNAPDRSVGYVAILAVGPEGTDLHWTAESKQGYVLCNGRPADGGILPCGDVTIVTLTPSDLALAALQAGAPTVPDVVTIFRDDKECKTVPVTIAHTHYSAEEEYFLIGDNSAPSRSFDLLQAKPAGSCPEEHKTSNCIGYFNDDENLHSSTKDIENSGKLEDVWDESCDPTVFDRSACLDPLARYAMVELCRAGWRIVAAEGAYEDQDYTVKRDNPYTVGWKKFANFQIPHSGGERADLLGPHKGRWRLCTTPAMKWHIHFETCTIYFSPIGGTQAALKALIEAIQALTFIVTKYRETCDFWLGEEKRLKTIKAGTFIYNSWWSDLKTRNWRLVQGPASGWGIFNELNNSVKHPTWEDKLLDPRNESPLDYLWQVVRHNSANGWDEWQGSGYDPKANLPDDKSELYVPIRATKAHDGDGQADSVFVYYGHGSGTSLGGVALSTIADECRVATGVIALFGCLVAGVFGYANATEAAFQGQAQRKGKGLGYNVDLDFFPNARIVMGLWPTRGGKAAKVDLTAGNVVSAPHASKVLRRFARILHLGIADRDLSWGKVVSDVNSTRTDMSEYLLAAWGDMDEKVWQGHAT